MTPVTFRFLDLPKELRLMVYERIAPVSHRPVIKHKTVTKVDPANPTSDDGASDPEPSMAAICKTLDVALLVTCSQIYHEAGPFLAPKSQELMVEHIGLIMDCEVLIADGYASFPQLTPFLRRCRSLAARKVTCRPTHTPHQIEIALAQDKRQNIMPIVVNIKPIQAEALAWIAIFLRASAWIVRANKLRS
jgi:hypothetical protein